MRAAVRETEAEFQQAIVELAIANGWLTYHTFDSRRSQPGFPDLVLARADELLFRELKAENGRLSASQMVWIAALERAGANVGVWQPQDWPTIEETLRRR